MPRPLPRKLLVLMGASFIGLLMFAHFAFTRPPLDPALRHHHHHQNGVSSPPLPTTAPAPLGLEAKRSPLTPKGLQPAADIHDEGAAFLAPVMDRLACPSLILSQSAIAERTLAGRKIITVHTFVLDITDFIPHHPGGPVIEQAIGLRDSLDLFMRHHQPSTALLFRKFCIGTTLQLKH